MRLARLGIALIIVFGCNKPQAPDCFQKAGEIVSIERSFNSIIKSLELHDFIHVTLIHNNENKVIVSGPENLLPEVITSLSDGTLLIDDENSCDWVRSFDVQPRVIVMAEVNQITNYSQGNIESFGPISENRFDIDNWQATGQINLELDCDSVFYRNHTGVSTTSLYGSSKYTYIYHNGLGPIDSQGLFSQKTSIRSNSINDVSIFADEKLVAWIEGSGNIMYSGNPEEIIVIQDGNGEVISID